MKPRSPSFLEAVLDRPRAVHWGMLAFTVILAVLAALPTLWAPARAFLQPLRVDTDPENMLDEQAEVRVFHRAMKERFRIYDMMVVGVENEAHPEGVFNVDSLGKIFDLTEFAKTLRWPDSEAAADSDSESASTDGTGPSTAAKFQGVVDVELLSPSTVDNIEPGDLGTVKFSWLMGAPPKDEAEARAVRDRARRLPLLDGTLLSEDGKALAIYLPLTTKDVAHRISMALQEHFATYGGSEKFYITGLPVAEDTFGVEMFKQMAISAPVAMLVIAILLYVFFRRAMLVVPPLVVAFVTVVQVMGLLVVCGRTIHIMSSMIPIFIMPIAVLDAIHIISEFFDRQKQGGDRRTVVVSVIRTLYRPMLFTSLTTAAGFASLALTPIPPVQVFGVFVAIGVLLAWFWTVTFIPVLLFTLPERLVVAAMRSTKAEASGAPTAPTAPTALTRFLSWLGRTAAVRGKWILAGSLFCAVLAAYGISRIQVNDNPTMWFHAGHPIRVADRMLNRHFGGTYMGHLVLEPRAAAVTGKEQANQLLEALQTRAAERAGDPAFAAVYTEIAAEVRERLTRADDSEALFAALDSLILHETDRISGETDRISGETDAASDETWLAWEEAALFVETERARGETFKRPEFLREIIALQEHLQTITDDAGRALVGKSSSLADIVRTVHRELYEGVPEAYRVPDSPAAVAQTLLTFQGSHRPRDLNHFVSPDYRQSCLWVQLRSGDNQDMIKVVGAVDAFLAGRPDTLALKPQWFGLTYINMVWQEEMVSGMTRALLGSFVIVLLMMIALFRSFWWGLLSMIPLSLTIGLIYGLIGLVGKDYDMPVTVLSSLSLGLAVDYAIHFLERSRAARKQGLRWRDCVAGVFQEPARAIARNAIVVGLGFLPLLLAPLVPYQTVGALIAAILLTAGFASLLVLPALIELLESRLFPERSEGDRA